MNDQPNDDLRQENPGIPPRSGVKRKAEREQGGEPHRPIKKLRPSSPGPQNAPARQEFVLDSGSGTPMNWSPSPDREMPDARPDERAAPDGATQNRPNRTARAKGKAVQAGPARTLRNYFDSSHDNDVLIADLDQLQSGAHEVIFRTESQWERHFGKPPTHADKDATCTITSLEPGIYQSKPRIWQSIEADEHANWEAQRDERDRKFAALMKSKRQSTNSFNKRYISGLLKGADAKYETPTGERDRNKAYEAPLQAGQDNPEVLIRFEDGAHLGVYLSLCEGTKHTTSFKEVTEKYGKDNVWLKNPRTFDYMTLKEFNRRTPIYDAAEKVFCEYMGREYRPNVFVRADPKVHSDKYKGMYISNELDEKEKRSKSIATNKFRDLLILTRHHTSLMQPKTMSWLDKKVYERRMQGASLAETLPQGLRVCDVQATRRNNPSAPVLMQISKHILAPMQRIPPGVPDHRVYVQNVNHKDEYTGNYRTLLSARKNDLELTDEQEKIINRPAPFIKRVHYEPPPHSSDEESGRWSPPQVDSSDDERFLAPGSSRQPISIPSDSSDDEAYQFHAMHRFGSIDSSGDSDSQAASSIRGRPGSSEFSSDSSDDEELEIVTPQAMPPLRGAQTSRRGDLRPPAAARTRDPSRSSSPPGSRDDRTRSPASLSRG